MKQTTSSHIKSVKQIFKANHVQVVKRNQKPTLCYQIQL